MCVASPFHSVVTTLGNVATLTRDVPKAFYGLHCLLARGAEAREALSL